MGLPRNQSTDPTQTKKKFMGTADMTKLMLRGMTNVNLKEGRELSTGAHFCLQNGVITTKTPDISTLTNAQVELTKEVHDLKSTRPEQIKNFANQVFQAETQEKDCQEMATTLDQTKMTVDAERHDVLKQVFKEVHGKENSGLLDNPKTRFMLDQLRKSNLKVKHEVDNLDKVTRDTTTFIEKTRRDIRAALGYASTPTSARTTPSFRSAS